MSTNTRRARDAVMGLIVALAPFAYQQFVQGNHAVASVTALVVVLLYLVYREADARTLDAVAGADAEEIQSVIRRIGRFLRRKTERE